MRLLIWLHRYLGIAVGWLIVAWCLSGIVMIYVPFPAVSLRDHVSALPLLTLEQCCKITADDAWLAAASAGSFSIEVRGGHPTLNLELGYEDAVFIDLASGATLSLGGEPAIDPASAVEIAVERSAHWPDRGEVHHVAELVRDQWTVGLYHPGQTLHRVSLGDPGGTEWYLDSSTGELVQATTARERRWNYVGSILHWLYFTPLRQRGQIWADTVIWASITALVLTLVGVYLGLSRARFSAGAALSPFRGLARWHHLAGLAFGLLTVTWLTSGLLSMNPWGLLEGTGPRGEVERLEGEAPTLSELGSILGGLSGLPLPPDTSFLEAAPLQGELFLVAHTRGGERHRLDTVSLAPASLSESQLAAAAASLRPEATIESAGMLHAPDAYYYDREGGSPWPVYRVRFNDDERTRYYIDAGTGQILDRVDASRGAYRWLFTALHSLDFAAIIRIRPFWDLLMITLLCGVAALSATGTWLGFRFLHHKLNRT